MLLTPTFLFQAVQLLGRAVDNNFVGHLIVTSYRGIPW